MTPKEEYGPNTKKAVTAGRMFAKAVALAVAVPTGIAVGITIGVGTGLARVGANILEDGADLVNLLKESSATINPNDPDIIDREITNLDEAKTSIDVDILSAQNLKEAADAFELELKTFNDFVKKYNDANKDDQIIDAEGKLEEIKEKFDKQLKKESEGIKEHGDIPKALKKLNYDLDRFLTETGNRSLIETDKKTDKKTFKSLLKTYRECKGLELQTRGNPPEGIEELKGKFMVGGKEFTTTVRNGSSERVPEGKNLYPVLEGEVEGNAATNLHVQTVEDNEGNPKAHLIRHGAIHVDIEKMSKDEKRSSVIRR